MGVLSDSTLDNDRKKILPYPTGVAGAIPTPLSYTYIAACYQSEAGFLQISDGKEMIYNGFFSFVNTWMSPRNLRCARASRRLSRAGIPVSHSKGTPWGQAIFLPLRLYQVLLQQHIVSRRRDVVYYSRMASTFLTMCKALLNTVIFWPWWDNLVGYTAFISPFSIRLCNK